MHNRKLKSLRALYDISQAELSKALGVTLNTYSAKERGVQEFSHSEIIKVWKYFKKKDDSITIDEIFFTDMVTNQVTLEGDNDERGSEK